MPSTPPLPPPREILTRGTTIQSIEADWAKACGISIEADWAKGCGTIPAKIWGDTEIAERGRSVLVMRARYRSARLTPHQRGWTDAG